MLGPALSPEDREAAAIRQGRFHRRLYLVERAAGLAEAGGCAGRIEQMPCRDIESQSLCHSGPDAADVHMAADPEDAGAERAAADSH